MLYLWDVSTTQSTFQPLAGQLPIRFRSVEAWRRYADHKGFDVLAVSQEDRAAFVFHGGCVRRVEWPVEDQEEGDLTDVGS